MLFIPYYILAALLIYFSYKSFRGGVEYLHYFRRELNRPPSSYTPLATIIAPCRGLDQDLAGNLSSLLAQDYPAYEVVFVVDSENDPAAEVIRNVSDERCRLVIAGAAIASSQKVENLREAVLHADASSEVFVFVDSDARPEKNWLQDLVAPLEDKSVGAATGYRWFISKKPTVASELRNMWNASIASALGPNRKSNFCWGGSMAIRREVFEDLEIRQRWKGTLSDDFTVTRAIAAAGLDIYFVPRALTPSIEDCSFAELFEFTTRQMKITRVYSSRLWLMSFLGSGLFSLVMLVSILTIVLNPRNDLPVLFALLTLIAVTIFSIGKSWLRMSAVRMVLGHYDVGLRRQFLPQITFWSLTPPLFLYNCLAAWLSQRVAWRGIVYEMKSPTETRIVGFGRGEK